MKTLRGWVVSDLHLLARRSQGTACFESVRSDLAAADLLVLNGDTFDFRWSTRRDTATSVEAALDWLRELARDFPNCEIHYVLGNHDCLTLFRESLTALASTFPRLHWHVHGLRLADALFLHGDCADRLMDPEELSRRRQRWANDRPRGRWAASAYLALDRLGLTQWALSRHFPRRQTVARIVHYLDRGWPDWRSTIRTCYFGHTHLPFADCLCGGITFHNTGSAIRGMAFKPLRFEVNEAPAQSLMTSPRHAHAR